MFFKKNKGMQDKKTNNNKNANENADNLSQNEELNEALSNALNTDDSRSGSDLIDEGIDEELDKLQAEIGEVKDKYLRLMAEFENYKRRTAKEKEDLRQTAGKDIIQSLLVVLDDMDRAAKQLEGTNDVTVIKEGVSLVFNKLRSVMQQKGLKKMELDNGQFNADLHEAITEVPAPSEDKKGKIIAEIEPGYYLNDKLIRHAKVVVGN
jgi:molecular chaperone GrpE